MRKFEVGPVGSGVYIKDVMQLEEIRKGNKSAPIDADADADVCAYVCVCDPHAQQVCTRSVCAPYPPAPLQQALLNLYSLLSSLLPPSSHTAVHYCTSSHPHRTLAAPSPHHPRRPCRRRGHLMSLAEAAGIELEEMIFFDNERGNCLVRI